MKVEALLGIKTIPELTKVSGIVFKTTKPTN